MRLFHGTSNKNKRSILCEGLKITRFYKNGHAPIWFTNDIEKAKCYGDCVFVIESPNLTEQDFIDTWQCASYHGIPARRIIEVVENE